MTPLPVKFSVVSLESKSALLLYVQRKNRNSCVLFAFVPNFDILFLYVCSPDPATAQTFCRRVLSATSMHFALIGILVPKVS